MIEIRTLSSEAFCLKDVSVLKKLPTTTYYTRSQRHGALGEAVVCKILYQKKEYLADVVTGQLYNPKTLLCMSGDLVLFKP